MTKLQKILIIMGNLHSITIFIGVDDRHDVIRTLQIIAQLFANLTVSLTSKI